MRSTGPNQNILSNRSSGYDLDTRTPDQIEMDNWKEAAAAIFSDTYGVVLTGWFNDSASDECAYEAGLTPQEFAYQQGDTYGLIPRKGQRPEVKQAKKASKAAKKAAAVLNEALADYKMIMAASDAYTAEIAAEYAAWPVLLERAATLEEFRLDIRQAQKSAAAGDSDAHNDRQQEQSDACWSYLKELNNERDEWGRW